MIGRERQLDDATFNQRALPTGRGTDSEES